MSNLSMVLESLAKRSFEGSFRACGIILVGSCSMQYAVGGNKIGRHS
jgi:hypothetical protein